MSDTVEQSWSVTLILTGDEMDPNVVSSELGMQPDQFWWKGAFESFGAGRRSRKSPAPWSGWKKFASPAVAQLPLDEQLNAWLEILEPSGDVLRRLADRGICIELNCFSATSDGFRLDRKMVAKLHAWGVELDCTFSCLD
jgi:hypothetical protein